MERVSLSDSVELSRIIYGMWRLADDTDTSTKHVQAKIEAKLSQGITSMEQADIYGDYESEALFGKALAAAPHLKDQIEIISKCDIALVSDKYPDRRVKHYDTSSTYIVSQVETSLKLMDVEALDVLLLHRPDPLMDAGDTGRALDMLVEDGKVKTIFEHFHLSFHVPVASISEMNQRMHEQGNGGIGPATADSRYVTEDVPYGLQLTALLGRLVGRPTKLHEAGIEIFSAMYDTDFAEENNLLAALDLENYGLENLQQASLSGILK